MQIEGFNDEAVRNGNRAVLVRKPQDYEADDLSLKLHVGIAQQTPKLATAVT